ncbi:amidase [Pacificibacter marinus]|uniref:Glutamyl-tRNA(Gln) amidotransferase subunit A n=1 Tax=Pacificibacter marinus TaxID=658057 RepID=A0A1Y5TJC7_9RHOB|nr:amidase family protein [Pacificibacter marinus]SEL13903.1 aspartyl-tRNA(Asn)/glutamyl-tRNA(Gln) amidotransferase subunit A [Pacificibacter marinus]SLN61785.1 Glutamyl-tRNA(Gln) amidotransferase subunit A [Pacificibacter marinus]
MTELTKRSMCDLGRAIGAGALDPIDITTQFLDAAEAHPFGPRIYARLTRDRAMAEAAAASKRAKLGIRRGLLDGVPVSWKDLFDTAGTATEAGSALLKGRVPQKDAEMVRRASAQGLVMLGKTHMSELAFSGLGLNPVTATTPCVNDHAAVSGGSSSGAAGSVAFGLASGAIGTDTGGSVRIPAAWNDLVGLKTSGKRLSKEGVVPLAESFDTVGPLVRTVEDAAEVFAILDASPAADLRGATLKGKRLLILETTAFDDIRDSPLAGFDHAVSRFKDAGAVIERGAIDVVEKAMALSGILFPVEAYGAWRDTIEANPDVMFGPILDRFRAGGSVSGVDYFSAGRALEMYRAEYLAATAGYDAVILPTAPILPPNVDRLLSDADYYVTENLLALRNTRIGNLMGLTGLTLPTGIPSVGVLLQTPPNTEVALLRLGAAAQIALS